MLIFLLLFPPETFSGFFIDPEIAGIPDAEKYKAANGVQ